jgi:hypothetical protein
MPIVALRGHPQVGQTLVNRRVKARNQAINQLTAVLVSVAASTPI